MKVLKTNPGAKRLIESLRNMGYDCSTAIADLVDNSIAAQASEIHIDIILKQNSSPAAIVIADNGNGMDRDKLHEAMRFGAYQEYSAGDLGKYGLGLKTASLSQCRTLTVSSKAKSGKDTRPHRNYMRWDIDHVYETDDWDLLVLSDNELKSWEGEILNHKTADEHGTVVLWTNMQEALPMLSDEDAREREKFLAHLIDEVSNHLRMIFHRFMQGAVTGRHKLNIYVCGELLVPWDPFCRNEKTKELDIMNLPIISLQPDGSKIKDKVSISPFVLPREEEFSSATAWKDASGPKNWNQQQGFYFYRNNRMLQAGGWSRLRSVDEHTKLLRVAVDFSSELDRSFQINITKMRAKVPDEIREKVSSHVSTWAKIARTRYDKKLPGKSGVSTQKKSDAEAQVTEPVAALTMGPMIFMKNTSDRSFSVNEDKKSGKISLSIPDNHDMSAIFELKDNDKNGLKRLCLAALGLLEAVYEKQISASSIPMATIRKLYKNL